VIHSRKERPYRCKRCGRTFTETKDSAFYRMHKPRWLVLAVLTLLAYGCPLQAIVAAFDLDERTVARWQREAGSQCKRAHQHLLEAGRVQLLQVQADQIRVSRLYRLHRAPAGYLPRPSDCVGAQEDPRRSAQTVHAGEWDMAGGWS